MDDDDDDTKISARSRDYIDRTGRIVPADDDAFTRAVGGADYAIDGGQYTRGKRQHWGLLFYCSRRRGDISEDLFDARGSSSWAKRPHIGQLKLYTLAYTNTNPNPNPNVHKT